MAKDSIEEEMLTPIPEDAAVPPGDADSSSIEIIPTTLGGGASEAVVEVIETIIESATEAETLSATNTESIESPAPPEPPLVTVDHTASGERREVVKSALLVSLGNLGSSVLGMVRQSFVASAGVGISGPFFSALSPAQKFNDFIVNGSVPGALIPTFNDYAENREELRRLVFTLVNLLLLVMAVSSLGYFFLAPWFTDTVLASSFNAADKLLTVQFTRIIFFSLLALGPFAVLQAALYAQKEFGWTAFAAAAYHAGIIVGVIATKLIGDRFFGLGHYSLALGVLLGALGEIMLLIPGMRNQHLRYMFVLDLRHPALRHILKLYAPIAFSFFVTSCIAFLDLYLWNRAPCMAIMQQVKSCGTANVSAMGLSATLIQFPGGLVASALSFAVLPTLTTHIREGDLERFKSTLLLGFRLGLLLMIPAAAGLIVLQFPIVKLIFQHGDFHSSQVVLTATVLQNFAYQLPFVAIDQLLIAAFYARKNTLIPVAVGVISILGYLVVALPFWQTGGVVALALANTVQNSLHAVILMLILWKSIGSLHLRGVLPALGKILVATAAMVVVAWGIQLGLAHVRFFSFDTFLGSLLTTIIAGGIAATIYFALVIMFKVEEVSMLKGAVLAKLGKK